MRKVCEIPKLIALVFVRLYQKTLSFDHGPMRVFYPQGYCRYSPTCSEYTYQAIKKYGLIKGSFLGIKRIFRCTPWSDGGSDPLV